MKTQALRWHGIAVAVMLWGGGQSASQMAQGLRAALEETNSA
jgi:hypothetical protein